MLHRYLLPLAPFLLIALNSILCLFFFLCLDAEIRVLKRRASGPSKNVASALPELTAKLEELGSRIQDAEERIGFQILPPAPRASFNLNKRTQVIRMSRRGERVENIAASLSIPRKEVELLLKVHRLVLDGSTKAT